MKHKVDILNAAVYISCPMFSALKGNHWQGTCILTHQHLPDELARTHSPKLINTTVKVTWVNILKAQWPFLHKVEGTLITSNPQTSNPQSYDCWLDHFHFLSHCPCRIVLINQLVRLSFYLFSPLECGFRQRQLPLLCKYLPHLQFREPVNPFQIREAEGPATNHQYSRTSLIRSPMGLS